MVPRWWSQAEAEAEAECEAETETETKLNIISLSAQSALCSSRNWNENCNRKCNSPERNTKGRRREVRREEERGECCRLAFRMQWRERGLDPRRVEDNLPTKQLHLSVALNVYTHTHTYTGIQTVIYMYIHSNMSVYSSCRGFWANSFFFLRCASAGRLTQTN